VPAVVQSDELACDRAITRTAFGKPIDTGVVAKIEPAL
jgi:hypothetical protein